MGEKAVAAEDQKSNTVARRCEREHLREEPFQPVKAIFVPSQQRGRDVAVYIFPNNHELCYEWHYQLAHSDNCTLTYMCCECKSLKTRDRKRYTRPVASCRIVNGYFTTDPLNPIRPHFCEPRNTTKIAARRLIIERCNELRDRTASAQRPASVELHELLCRISSENFGVLSADERLAVIEQFTCPSENGLDNARRVIQRAQQRARQATSLITEIKTTTIGLPGNDIDLNALHMSEGMISSELVKHLNTESGRFDSKEWITARSVAFFLNDTMAYCVDKNVTGEDGCDLEATDVLDLLKPRLKEDAEEEEKIMNILSNLSGERYSGAVKQEPHDEIGTVPTHPAIPSSNPLQEGLSETIDKLEGCDAHEAERIDRSPGSSVSNSQSSTSVTEGMEDSFEDRNFVVEGKKLLELFRYCPICGTNMDASGSSFRLSAVGNAPVVDFLCMQCLKEKGKGTRWEGCSGDRKSMEQK
ncbi:hypothetical protein NECAME_13253 [Necator americanus]|uniref:Uncharacterized protein n=1 Tax=Necator americanus TaxID=51031 RepID=W2SW93_NECAM|nr:hypothetical protein NECAME_13253 [Necator americanus]ETN74029.1 hypothetical protein NECAME_13253 [Necator americanus]